MLDTMIIMQTIWEDDKGIHARFYGIKRFWRKASIILVYWECGINNNVGSSRVTISMKTLNKDNYDNICDLIEQLAVK